MAVWNRNLLKCAAVMVLIGVIALFWFHDSQDSFLANGPVTALRAAREAMRVKLGIIGFSFVAILFMAVLRCWLFARIRTRDERPTAHIQPLDPAVRV